MSPQQRTVAAALVECLSLQRSAAPCIAADLRFASSIDALPDSYELSLKQEYALWRIAERHANQLKPEAAAIVQARRPKTTTAPPRPQYPLRRRGHR